MTPNHDPTRTANPDATRTHGEPPTRTADAAPNDSTVGPYTPTDTSGVDAPPGFLIDREIGVGGMGIVYLARQLGLNRPVALKLVKGSEKVDAKALIRFLAEAEAVAAVRHPNVVEVYSYGDHQGRPYMALEYCPGGDLTNLVCRDPQGSAPKDAAWFRKVADLMAKVADGVNAAHAQGIVHRDLKPANVLLTADGTPKVADFGLAKRGIGSDLTNTLAIMGTPAYMSPEQAGGGTKFVGPEADVWALGVMLYELCCGERPIDTSGPVLDALARIANPTVPSLRGQLPAVPTDLSLIVHKCLSADPRDRYPTAGTLATDLRNWLDGKPISARRAGVIEQAAKWAKRNKKAAGIALGVFLTMALATAISFGFGVEANKQAGEARREKKNAEDAAEQTQQKADELSRQLKESRRLVDLGRLREAAESLEENTLFGLEKLAAIAPENRCIVWGLLRRRAEISDLYLNQACHSEADFVAWSPDGRRIAVGSEDGRIWLWDATTGRKLFALEGHDKQVRDVTFSPNGEWVITGSEDHTARVWDVATGRSLFELKGHAAEVTSVACSPDSSRVATGSEDKSVRVWDMLTGRPILECRGHMGGVTSVAFSPDGQHIMSGSSNDTVRIWHATRGECLLEFKTDGASCVAYSPDGARILTASQGPVQVRDAATGRTIVNLMGRTPGRFRGRFSPDGRLIVTGATYGMPAMVWDATTGRCIDELNGPLSGSLSSTAFSPDGRRIVTSSFHGWTRVWDTDTGQGICELMGHRYGVTSVAFSPDGRQIATASTDKTALLWDARSGIKRLELTGHSGEVTGTTFSPDGRRLLTASVDKTVRVWNVATGTCEMELKGHEWGFSGIAISANGSRIVTGSADKTARVWEATTGQCITVLKGHTEAVTCVAISPDGRRVVTGSEDATARVWDSTSGENLLVCRMRNASWTQFWSGFVNSHKVRSVAFSPGGQRVLIGADDGTVKVWDAVSGKEVTVHDPG